MISFRKLGKSITYAMRGVGLVFREEQNMRIHGLFAVLALFLIYWLDISLVKSLLVVISIGIVLILETVNTVIERLIDMQKPTVHKYVSDVKDMMAASVLFAAILALIVGILVFGPEIWSTYLSS